MRRVVSWCFRRVRREGWRCRGRLLGTASASSRREELSNSFYIDANFYTEKHMKKAFRGKVLRKELSRQDDLSLAMYQEQFELEQSTLDEAVYRTEQLKSQYEVAGLLPGKAQTLLQATFDKVKVAVESLREKLRQELPRVAVSHSEWIEGLLQLPADKLSVIALHETIRKCIFENSKSFRQEEESFRRMREPHKLASMQGIPATGIAMEIGTACQAELNQGNMLKHKKWTEFLEKKSPSVSEINSYAKHQLKYEAWTPATLVQIGTALLHVVADEAFVPAPDAIDPNEIDQDLYALYELEPDPPERDVSFEGEPPPPPPP